MKRDLPFPFSFGFLKKERFKDWLRRDSSPQIWQAKKIRCIVPYLVQARVSEIYVRAQLSFRRRQKIISRIQAGVSEESQG